MHLKNTWETEELQGLRIIAIGGGGFTHDNFPSLDDFCVRIAGVQIPRIGYIGTASLDDPIKIDRFHTRFSQKAEIHEHIPMSLGAAELRKSLKRFDLVYVGGGNTERLLQTWRQNGWGQALANAAQSGTTLAGVSAGAVCWFEKSLFNPGEGSMRPIEGLGLLNSSACPHYSSEPQRRDELHKAIAQNQMPGTIAIDDGVAVAFDENGPIELHKADPVAGAYYVHKSDTGPIVETPLEEILAQK